jgi:hypothetical protein
MSEHATPVYHPHPEFVQKAHISGMDAYHALCQKADRRAIVGFLPHGNRAATTDARARRVVPIAAA